MSPVPTVRWKVASIWKKLPRYSSVAIATIAIAASLLFYVTMTQTTKLVPIHLEVATGPTIPEMGKDFMELRSTKKYEWVYRLETGPFNRRTENTTFLLSSTNNKVELEVRGCVIGGATAKRKSELTIKPGDKSAPIVQLEPTGTIEVDDRLFLLIGVKNHPADDPKFRSSFQLESK